MWETDLLSDKKVNIQYSEIIKDKTIESKLKVIPNDDKQLPIMWIKSDGWNVQVVVVNEPTNHNLIKVPKGLMATNKKTWIYV